MRLSFVLTLLNPSQSRISTYEVIKCPLVFILHTTILDLSEVWHYFGELWYTWGYTPHPIFLFSQAFLGEAIMDLPS